MEDYNYIIESGVFPKYIIEYFTEISERVIDNKEFIGSGWRVKLIEHESRKHRFISIPSTSILFYAEQGICDELVHNFRMKFLSAGG